MTLTEKHLQAISNDLEPDCDIDARNLIMKCSEPLCKNHAKISLEFAISHLENLNKWLDVNSDHKFALQSKIEELDRQLSEL